MAETEATYSEEAHSSRDTALFVSAFFDELYQAGVRDVVISPGSRSTPLAMIAYQSPLKVYLDVDERGAGFFALGIGKATGCPACLICTSGTALANYYPAVMEAESSRVPLIILSGDRPQHLQQVGAPQTCDQLKAFSSHVKKFWQMPEPFATPKRIAYVRQIAREAYAAVGAKTVCSGAVHLNFPFDEPLKPDLEADGLFSLGRVPDFGNQNKVSLVVETAHTLDVSAAQRLHAFLQNHRVIALCGEATLGVGVSEATVAASAAHAGDAPSGKVLADGALRFDAKDIERAALQAFSECYDVPLLADPLSQLRSDIYEAVIENYDNIMVRSDCPSFDAILRFGRWPVSKRLSTVLQNAHIPQIVVDPLETRDFTSTTSTFIKMAPLDFVISMLEYNARAAKEMTKEMCSVPQPAVSHAASQTPPSAASLPKYSFVKEWAALNQEERERILVAKTTQNDVFEGSYAAALIEHMPENSLLFSANSMAIRALDTFYVKQPKKIAVLANRGLNGIDGTISTALGAAQAFDQTVCLTGDLTLLHDINALALQHEMKVREGEGYRRPSIVIVLMNNSGGAIFDILPQKQDNPYFERIFLTPQNIDFSAAAQAFSVPYRSVASVEQFEQAFDQFVGHAGIHLIDICLPLQGVKERYAPFQ